MTCFANSASALETLQPGYPAYVVTLEISRNGVHLGAPVATAAEGEPITADLFTPARRQAALRVSHRVTPFPGAEDSKALLELELFGVDRDGEARRLVAPTLGIDLDTEQAYEVATPQGVISVRARVEGLAILDETRRDGPQGVAYPSG
nr:hypothetical protein [Panacagrimonas sp.]